MTDGKESWKKGEVAESKVKSAMIENSVVVSDVIQENVQYDIVCDIGGRLYKVQVKHMGELEVKEHSYFKIDMRRNKTAQHLRTDYDGDKVDLFAGYYPSDDEVYLFEPENHGKTKQFNKKKNDHLSYRLDNKLDSL